MTTASKLPLEPGPGGGKITKGPPFSPPPRWIKFRPQTGMRSRPRTAGGLIARCYADRLSALFRGCPQHWVTGRTIGRRAHLPAIGLVAGLHQPRLGHRQSVSLLFPVEFVIAPLVAGEFAELLLVP